jgi:acylphosphatase
MNARRVVISGRVQGVWYRNWTVREARALGLRGWVRNRADGAVEALLIGPDDAISTMLNACRRGPPAARVVRVEVSPAEDDGSADFTRIG